MKRKYNARSFLLWFASDKAAIQSGLDFNQGHGKDGGGRGGGGR